MLEISNNARSLASCWRLYKFNYIDKIVPRSKSSHLILGSIVHKAFELSATGSTDSDIIGYIKKTYEELLGKTELVDQEQVRLDMYTAMGMWAYYPYKDLTGFTEYIPEMEFKVKLKGKRNVRFVGRVDGLLKENDKWWIREIKTTGLTPRQFKGRSATSAQVTGYIYALRQMGYDVKGVMFDTIKKPLLRKRVSETCDDFGKRIMADYYGDSLVKNEDERKAYLRHNEYRSETQIEHWMEDMNMLVDDIRSKQKSNQWYRNMDNCWRFNSLCQYSMLCSQEVPDQTTMDVFFEKKGEK